MRLYWIEIQTPEGALRLWSYGAPAREFEIAKRLGYEAAYGREGEHAGKITKGYAGPDTGAHMLKAHRIMVTR